MRRESEPQRDLIAPGRFTGFGILALSIALGAFVFFAVGPMVERNAHLDAIEDLDDRERLERGLRTLCNTQQNIKLLNQQLAEKSRADRNRVTPLAKELGCLDKLDSTFQAEHHLWMGSEREAVDLAVASGEAAIEPAIEALEEEEGRDDAVRERAMRALVALSARLLTDHKTRIEKRLADDDTSPAANALRSALGLEMPAAKAPETKPPETTPSAHDADMGHGSDHDMSGDMDADADMGGADMDAEDVNLGSGSFRLRLDGLGAPPAQRRRPPAGNGFQLREPGLNKPSTSGGVLFKKERPGLGVSEEIGGAPGDSANP